VPCIATKVSCSDAAENPNRSSYSPTVIDIPLDALLTIYGSCLIF
jgi:hypothetical protein